MGELIKVIPSLKDYQTPAGFHAPITRIGDRVVGINEDNESRPAKQYSKVETPDPVVQKILGVGGNSSSGLQSPNPLPGNFAGGAVTQNFAGLGYTNVSPADPNMCAGPTAVIQTINNSSSSYFKIWDRNGNVLLNQTLIVNLVASPGYTGSGDPVAMYDQMADRYLLTEFGHAGAGSGINTLIACISQTNDPLGAWNVYKFTDASFFPDYPKWSAMPNAYYASTNDFNTAGTAYLGSSVYAFDKAAMIAGSATAASQHFRLTFNSFPVNVSGATPPPANTPGMFMYYTDDDFTADPNDKDSIGILNFQPNFAVPANTTLTLAQNLMTAPFKSSFCGGRNCVPSASGNGYDALADRIMNRVVYRNFGSYEAIVLNYTVDANVGLGSSRAGLRWYELRKTGGPWSIYQQSTFAPCGTDWRWMGSININSKGQIALGYDLSSTSKYASMYFTGRNATDPLNTMTAQETLIQAGTAYGTFGNRWGDYNEVTPDVVNDSLFWMTSMYGSAASSWATRVAQFKLGDCNVESSSFGLTQALPSVPEGQNIVYTNTVNNTGCVAITNYLLTDTLPSNVTFISATNGGAYNAGNRVVSWTVNLASGTSQNYQFTVIINAGAYFAPVTLLNEPVAGPGIPASWTTTIGTGPNNWAVSSAQSHSAPSSLFAVDNATAITDFRITSSPIALGPPSAKLTFWHNYNTESGWDGGVVEISTNGGGTWVDLGPRMTINGYNNSVGGTNPIAGRSAFSGNSGGWIQTTVDLTPYANTTAQFRFRMTSDDNTAATGWYVDDINITSVAQVNMRTTLFGTGSCASQFKDTVTLILPPSGCTPPTIITQPSSTTVCASTAVSFSTASVGTSPYAYQWQESTNGGGTFTNITNGGIYSNATTATLNISAVTAGMTTYQYRCVVTGQCAPTATSNAAVLTVVTLSVGGAISPATTSVCGTTNTGLLTLSGFTGAILRWESSIDGGTTWVPIVNTTNTYTFVNIAQTTLYRAVVQATGCAAANSAVATVTFNAAPPMVIVADPGATLCAGDPTRLTVMDGAGTSPIALTQSSSTTITVGNSVSCNAGGLHTDNSYWRAYNLSTLGLTSALTVTTVTFGIEQASGGAQPVTVNLYINTGGTFPAGTRTLVGSQAASVPNQAGTLFTVNFATPVVVPNTAVLVVELFTPSGQATGRSFFIGSNTAAQTGPSYISAATCGITNPTDLAAIGFPNDHIILNIGGTVAALGGITTGTFLWSPAAGLSSTTSNPTAASPATTTTYTVVNNNGTGCNRTATITITVNQRPAVTTQPANVSVCSTTSASFTVAATGTGISYQWQESTNGGTTYTNITNGGIYSGATTTTLTVNPVSNVMNGYRYRCAVSGICIPVALSNGAILTVKALPNVAVTPTSGCGGVAGINGLLLSTGSLAPPVPGTVTINSGAISVAIPDNSIAGAVSNLAVSTIPGTATVTGLKVTFNMTHTWDGDIVMALKSPTGAVLNLDYYLSNTGGAGATTGFTNTSIGSTGVAALNTGSGSYTGLFKADAVITGGGGSGGPTGYTPTATTWAPLYGGNGTYTLAMYDGGAGDVGVLTSWSLQVDYTTPGGSGSPLTFTWAPAAGLYNNATTTNAYVAGTQTPSVYAAPTQFTAYTVTGTDATTGCSNTAVALVNYTPPAPTVTPNPVAMCLGDAAVRLTSSSATSTTLSFNSGTIAVAVPDNNTAGTFSNLTVSGVPANGNVSGLKATWNMTHTWDGDMIFVLKSATGAILNLDYFLSSTGGTGATTGFVNTAVGSTGVTALSAGSGTYTGLFKADALLTGPFGPTGPTGYLPTTTSWTPLYGAGVAANGTYTLAMYDGGAGDVGVLTSWNLDVTYVVGVPSTAATWSPVGGLFTDPAATVAYTGTPRDTVYTRPTPAGVYNYNVTVNSLPLPPAVPATPMAGGNGNNMVLFNVANNNSIDYTLTGISTNAFATAVAPSVRIYRKVSAIAGNPGVINAGNGWDLMGTATNVSVTANTLNNVLSGLNILVPTGATYGIALEFTGAATFPAYTNGSGVVKTYT
ncbi:MAG: immune inhibitor A, partial [Sphingobacteriales bacterium]|nr:immune inhibitor A [Sphingobacteriales bacterium]